MEFDATFWAAVALFIFLGVVLYLKVPGKLAANLDARADTITSELEEARQLREEAQALVAEYQRKRKEAEAEADKIVAAAKHEAEIIAVDARKKTEEFVTRRTALAESKIAQAESHALDEVRAAAIEIAVNAAQSVISEKMTGANAEKMIKSSIAEVKARLN